ncbi:MAG: SGNH/GDSL hydrolase family protein [Candidatus Omnitrophica bacterium]|nr:SGNH/GDSL hydrolase family protein [Candidatus Omnitrophota bacterium]
MIPIDTLYSIIKISLVAGFLICLVVLWRTLKRDHFWCLILGFVIAFGVGEGLCRFFGLGNLEKVIHQGSRVKDPKAPYVYQPGGEVVVVFPDNPRGYFEEGNKVVAHINSKGFRGPEVDFRKESGTTRIVVLGDSFVFGVGVKDQDTLPAQLEQELKRDFKDIEVLNFGVAMTNTPNYVNVLTKYGVQFDPDMVLMVLFLNDTERIGTVRFFSEPQLFRSLRRSRFLNLILSNIEKPIVHQAMVQHYRDGYQPANPGWVKMKNSIRKARDLSQEKGFKLGIVIYPVLYHLDERYPFTQIHEKIRRFCESKGIETVDLLEAFRGMKDKDLWVHPLDPHPNEKAQRLAARELAKSLHPWLQEAMGRSN